MILEESAEDLAAKLEYPACPLCGSNQRELRLHLSKPHYLARCTACGLNYLYPRSKESVMQQAYRQASYYKGGTCGYADTGYVAQESALRSTFKRFLQNLAERGLTGRQLLEIGCGYGYLLDEARPFFHRRMGTEFSPQGAEMARTTGAEVFIGGVEQVPSEAKFECVVATQVIEHVYDPLPFVRRLAEHTAPGGHIVLATPDIGGVLRKVMGRHWPSFKTPEHVVYFDFPSLSLLMSRAGLHNIRRLPYPHAFPLGLIAAKFGVNLPTQLARHKIWVPATTVAAYGRVPSA